MSFEPGPGPRRVRSPVSPRFSRRACLGATAALLGGGAAPAWLRQIQDDPLRGEALFRDVEAYAALGEHRAASEADVRTSRWLRHELRRFGFAADNPRRFLGV